MAGLVHGLVAVVLTVVFVAAPTLFKLIVRPGGGHGNGSADSPRRLCAPASPSSPRCMRALLAVLGGAVLALLCAARPADTNAALLQAHALARSPTTWAATRNVSARTAVARAAHEAVASAMRSVDELMAAGGIYIYPTDDILAAAGARPHFYSSHGPRADWVTGADMYSLEVTLPRLLQASPFVTTDAETAALFLVPHYAVHEAHHTAWHGGGGDYFDVFKQVSAAYLLPLVSAVANTTYFRRRGGADHLFVFPADFAWDNFGDAVKRALAGALYFGYWSARDREANLVSVPAPVPISWGAREVMNLHLFGGADFDYLADRVRHPGGPEGACQRAPRRSHLAVLFGQAPGDARYSHGIRQALVKKYGGGADPRVRVGGHVGNYVDALRDSTFCLCPQGWSPWSPRLYFVISVGCIPVLYTTTSTPTFSTVQTSPMTSTTTNFFDMQLPFSTRVDWNSFTVRIPVANVTDTGDILARVSASEICDMRAALAHWAPLLLWSTSPSLPLLLAVADAWERSKEMRRRPALHMPVP